MKKLRCLTVLFLAVTATSVFNYQGRDSIADLFQTSSNQPHDASVSGHDSGRFFFAGDLDDVASVLLENRLRPGGRLNLLPPSVRGGRLHFLPWRSMISAETSAVRISVSDRRNPELAGLAGTNPVVSMPNTTAPPAL